MRGAGAALVLALVAGCQPSGPNTAAPRRNAPTINALVDAAVQPTIRAAVRALGDDGLTLRRADEDAGVVESEYFDLATVDPHSESYPSEQRFVRLRIAVTADTMGRGSLVDLFVFYQPYQLGMESRSRERLVPRDHPGAAYARKLIERIAKVALSQ